MDAGGLMYELDKAQDRVERQRRALSFAVEAMEIALAPGFDADEHREYWTEFVTRQRAMEDL